MYRVLNCFIILFLSFPALSQKTYTLQECIDSAVAKDIPVKRAGLQTEVAHTNWRQSRYNLLPDLNAGIRQNFNYGRSLDQSNAYVSANTNISTYDLNSNVTLFNGLSLQNRIKQNAYMHEATKMEHQQAKDELVMTVILAYLLVLNNEDEVALAIQQANTSQATLDRLKVLNSQGAVRPSDFTDLQGQLMNDQLSIITSKNNMETNKLRLTQLMQIKYDSTMRLQRISVEEFLTLYNASPDEIYQTSLNQFARIKAVELRTKSSAYTVKAERGRLYPSLTFGAGMGSAYFSTFTTPAGNKIPYMDQLKNNKSTFLGFGLNIPIFNALSTRNRIKLATINLKD
ncbi:MAG: TolC family protein, partial [Flavisolibacter sp.]